MPSWLLRLLIHTCSHGVNEFFTPSYHNFRFSRLFAHLCEDFSRVYFIQNIIIYNHHPTAFRKIRNTLQQIVENSRDMIEKRVCEWISYPCYNSRIHVGQHLVNSRCYLQRNIYWLLTCACFKQSYI